MVLLRTGPNHSHIVKKNTISDNGFQQMVTVSTSAAFKAWRRTLPRRRRSPVT